jgi:hypothetical protein
LAGGLGQGLVGEGLGQGFLGVGLGVGLSVGVGQGVLLGVGVGWGDVVGVGVGYGDLVGVGVGWGDMVGVGQGVLVGVGVGCGDLVGVGVGCGDLVGVGVGWGDMVGVGVGVLEVGFDLTGGALAWERTLVGGGVDGGVGGDGRESGEMTWGTPPGAVRLGGDLGCGWLCGRKEKLEVMAKATSPNARAAVTEASTGEGTARATREASCRVQYHPAPSARAEGMLEAIGGVS